MRKIAVVVGTRPEAIKLAPLVHEIRRRGAFRPVLVSTGQHREMLEQALGAFGLRPDVDLDIMSPGQTLHEITSRTISSIRTTFREQRPAWVIVQGDTTTAFAAALAAFYDRLPVAHVEAGLRSGERYSPFPEEINRRLIDHLSSALFAPTDLARRILVGEGFDPTRVFLTGNTVVDALLAAREIVRRRPPVIAGLDPARLAGRRMILVTAHRRESFGPAFEGMCRAMLRIVRDAPDTVIVYPVHLNPNVDATARRLLGAEPRVLLLPPVSYLQFISLLDRAYIVLTDSGGVQEEAPAFRRPVLVMREVTERMEGVEAGVSRLVGTSEDRIHEETLALLASAGLYDLMARGDNPYGDGTASRRIAEIIEQLTEPSEAAFVRAGEAPAAAVASP